MVKGYKVFNPDWSCRGFQYEVGKTYEIDEKPRLCDVGFYFCKRIADCFNFYRFNSNNKVAEIEALGDIDTDGGVKSCTNKIKIVRELTWQEVLDLVNIGKHCIGFKNTGNWNSGNCNSGDFNKASFSTGCFNTEYKPLFFFDKPTSMTFIQWRDSQAYMLLKEIDFDATRWIPISHISSEEIHNHPEAETIGGYFKNFDNSDCFIRWWHDLTDEEKDVIKAIPNFDADKFFEITGIKVD